MYILEKLDLFLNEAPKFKKISSADKKKNKKTYRLKMRDPKKQMAAAKANKKWLRKNKNKMLRNKLLGKTASGKLATTYTTN